jgi:hypothetical protein
VIQPQGFSTPFAAWAATVTRRSSSRCRGACSASRSSTRR